MDVNGEIKKGGGGDDRKQAISILVFRGLNPK